MSKTHKMIKKNWKTLLGKPRHGMEDNIEMSVWTWFLWLSLNLSSIPAVLTEILWLFSLFQLKN